DQVAESPGYVILDLKPSPVRHLDRNTISLENTIHGDTAQGDYPDTILRHSWVMIENPVGVEEPAPGMYDFVECAESPVQCFRRDDGKIVCHISCPRCRVKGAPVREPFKFGDDKPDPVIDKGVIGFKKTGRRQDSALVPDLLGKSHRIKVTEVILHGPVA